MQAYRFETRISKKGTIKLPPDHELIDQEVEIIIFPKQNIRTNKNAASEFVKKWAGFLSDSNEDSKYEYLRNKYK